MTTIGDFAFAHCGSLTSVAILDDVTTIGSYAFAGCTALTSVTLPTKVNEIGDGAFADCRGLTSVTIPERVTAIVDYTFAKCTGLAAVNIPEGVTRIGGQAFEECTSLVALTLPASLESADADGVENRAFAGCRRLSFVIAPPSLRESHGDCFAGCPLLSQLESNTEKNRRKALRLQYWSALTHRLCTELRREWVVVVMLVAQRLGAEETVFPRLPIEMWLMILGFIPLGLHPV